ncbi:TolC family outer membrane protein [Intestinirhabdus alba]|jgi:adhesin transport system outer membrane protein|uniref:TolC family outer membrane protein n=1 Tax=Intestinirhabdus alba TaxID=2899544 RepID=A0A6L6IDL6_9ENTR|nr:TolC family outer membrane protein [Intestinirhabdus alba]MTH44932.1 TolC family outer membrane protein [Intestinirhabdus alba]
MNRRYLPLATLLLAAIAATQASESHGAELIWPVTFDEPGPEPEAAPPAVQPATPAAPAPRVASGTKSQRRESPSAFLNRKRADSLPAVAGATKPDKPPRPAGKSGALFAVDGGNTATPIAAKQETPRLQAAPAVRDPGRSSRGAAVSLGDAVRLAMKWHPTIKRAEREYAQSKASIEEAKAGWYPTLSARVKSGIEQDSYRRDNEKSNTLSLNASQMIYDFGKTSSKVELADATTHRSGFSLDKSINDIAYEAASAFLQAIRYQQMVEVARGQVQGISAINALAQRRAKLGASAESDYSQSKVRLAAAEAQLHEYEAQAWRWNSALDSLVNRPLSGALQREFPQGMDAACQRVDIHHLTSPAIALAEAQIKMAKEQVKAFRAEYYPTISVNPTWEYELENRSDSRGNRASKGEWGIFLNVSAPLYEGGARLSRTQQAERALQASQFNLDAEKTEARRKIVEASSQIASLHESLSARRVREKESIRTRDLYRLQYLELGNRSFSDLLSAESEIHQTRMEILNGQFTVATLSLDCLYTSGNLVSYFTE